MKRILLLLCLSFLTRIGIQAAPEIIYSQPDGELRIYNRNGKTVKADEEGTLITGDQEGSMSIVYASAGVVYLQDPVSGYTMSGSWVKGTLSTDGRTITIPLGQYIDYTRSFDIAYQLQILNYDSTNDTYVLDESATEVTYTLDDEGGIRLNDTSDQRILGLIFHPFGNPQGAAIGQDFMYLDQQWIGEGDYESSYTLMDIQAQQPPSDMETRLYYATSAEYDGAAYYPYSGTVHIGRDADDVWIQGISRLLPSAWIRGTMQADGKILFPTGQFMGTVEGIALFMHGATLNEENSFNIKDVEMVIEDDEYITYDFVFVTTSQNSLQYVNFYMGATLSPEEERPTEAPNGLQTQSYTLTHADGNRKVGAAQSDGEFYIQGIWEGLPTAWVKGTVESGTITFAMPQYLGTYDDEGIDYPIYFTAFDAKTGQMLRQLTFDYDAETGTLSSASSPIAISINKTGYLSVQDYYFPTLVCDTNAIEDIAAPADASEAITYDLGGRKVSPTHKGILVRETRQPDGTRKVSKIVKR